MPFVKNKIYNIELGEKLTDKKIEIKGKNLTLEWVGKRIVVWSRNNYPERELPTIKKKVILL